MDNNDCLYKEILNHNLMYCILNWSTQTTGQNNGSLKVVKINTAIALVTADDSSPPTASCIYSTRPADLHGKHEVIIGVGGESKWHKWHAVEPNQYTVPSRNHRLTFPSSCGSWCDVWELSFSAECFCSSSTFNWFFFFYIQVWFLLVSETNSLRVFNSQISSFIPQFVIITIMWLL